MVAMNDGTGLQYLLTDHLGSTVAVTNQSGTLTSQQRYPSTSSGRRLPFGAARTIPNSPILSTDFTYTGQRKLDDGMGERTILSGIAASYPNPEELVGTQVCFIANFEPRKLRGVMSEGMILSAENADGKLVLIRPTAVVTNGVEVK